MLMKARQEWPPQRAPGPWDSEPNRLHWIDQATGLKCAILRGTVHQLCGYVRVPRGHPMYPPPRCRRPPLRPPNGPGPHLMNKAFMRRATRDINGRRLSRLTVHGGVSWATKFNRREMKRGYWIGFDTGHLFDVVPDMVAVREALGFESRGMETYKDIAYVKSETERLAAQIGQAGRKRK